MKKLIFHEDFTNQTKLNLNNWNITDSGGGFGNNELQYYKDSHKNLFFKDNALHIKAFKEEYKDHQYTSAKITTKNKINFKYGHFEVLMKMPKGAGAWPAVWFLGDYPPKTVRWPAKGEIDFLEYLGRMPNTVHYSLHSKLLNHIKNNNIYYNEYVPNLEDDYNLYEMTWTKDYFKFYINKRLIKTFIKNANYTNDHWPFDHEFFMIINLAVGGNWGGKVDDSMLPFTFSIKHIKVYELEE